jgi:hypothetical protein
MLSPLFFVVIQVAALAEPSMAEGAFLRGREMKGGAQAQGLLAWTKRKTVQPSRYQSTRERVGSVYVSLSNT